jgi:hypothetical protein
MPINSQTRNLAYLVQPSGASDFVGLMEVKRP